MPRPDAATLLRAYLATIYTVARPDGERAFRVGDVLPFVVPATYITGWNPQSRDTPTADNERANAALAARLHAHGASLLAARSAAPDGGHAEAGWLALGLAAADVDACARAFGQNAVVHALPGEAARLRCYAVAFGCATAPSGVDTRFVDWLP